MHVEMRPSQTGKWAPIAPCAGSCCSAVDVAGIGPVYPGARPILQEPGLLEAGISGSGMHRGM